MYSRGVLAVRLAGVALAGVGCILFGFTAWEFGSAVLAVALSAIGVISIAALVGKYVTGIRVGLLHLSPESLRNWRRRPFWTTYDVATCAADTLRSRSLAYRWWWVGWDPATGAPAQPLTYRTRAAWGSRPRVRIGTTRTSAPV